MIFIASSSEVRLINRIVFLYRQRKYKCKQTGTKAGRTTGITDEQIKKLASVGFSFSLQDDFETRFKHLVEFKKEHGHTKVPVFYT